ncbi:MAG: zinc ribbon domain-containing protein [Desulfovibrio sp.]|nr:zinc ribbon domain-containing protein [Desulfovibrio sp.]
MPMFDFVCTACGEKFEELVRGEEKAPACPKCGFAATERQLSVPSPLKTGAFPFKPGPVRPMGRGAPSPCSAGSCGGCDPTGCGGAEGCAGCGN